VHDATLLSLASVCPNVTCAEMLETLT
jgi:hypothetical protein